MSDLKVPKAAYEQADVVEDDDVSEQSFEQADEGFYSGITGLKGDKRDQLIREQILRDTEQNLKSKHSSLQDKIDNLAEYKKHKKRRDQANGDDEGD